MPITAADVAALRARTGVSILEVKKALEEANGDQEKAIEILRKRGIAGAAKKAGRDQMEGLVAIAREGKRAALVELKCETDFVARDTNFKATLEDLVKTLLSGGEDDLQKVAGERVPALVQKLGENISLGRSIVVETPVLGTYVHTNGKIGVIVGLASGSEELARDAAMHAAAMNPLYVHPDDADMELLKKERDIWTAQLAKEGKPAQIVEKIMMGKEKKFREEHALITQPFAKDPSKTVGSHLGDVKVTAYARIAIGE